jgi:hypothetical protein
VQVPLPTDNLYKFYCLFGLSTAIFFVSLLAIQYRAVNDEIHKANVAAANAYVQISRLEITLEQYDPVISQGVRDGLVTPSNKKIPGKKPTTLLDMVFYVPSEKASSAMKTRFSEINDILERQAQGHITAKFALDRVDKLKSDLFYLLVFSIVFILGGLFQYLHGMWLWLTRTHVPLDAQATNAPPQ